MTGSILYQNADSTITLIDIPLSISEAQGIDGQPPFGILKSTPPILEPFTITNEPKNTSTANQNALASAYPHLLADDKNVISKALDVIRSEHQGLWCCPRQVAADSRSILSKRKRASCTDVGNADIQSEAVARPDESCFKSLAEHADSYTIDLLDQGSMLPEQPWESVIHNPLDSQIELHLRSTCSLPVVSDAKFLIPAQSTFLLGDCNDAPGFRNAVKAMAQEHDTRRKFDFVLLDPPWPNASAKRKGEYATQYNLKQMKRLLLQMDLDLYIERNGLLGIWITNKAAVRELVVGPGGLFDHLNVTLEEEWLWLKVTAKGEPVSSLESLWRKPYEILLLGRAATAPDAAPRAGGLKRVLVGVPDMHSRKPCLKRLVGPLLKGSTRYTALEVFARHLVSGWWSWGNEVIRYNGSDWWMND